jgi:hypothetical protein
VVPPQWSVSGVEIIIVSAKPDFVPLKHMVIIPVERNIGTLGKNIKDKKSSKTKSQKKQFFHRG